MASEPVHLPLVEPNDQQQAKPARRRRCRTKYAPAPMPPLMVGRERACELLSIGLNTLDNLLRKGVIPSKRFGNRVLIPLAALQQLAADIAAAKDNS